MKLSQAQSDHFDREGYVVAQGALSDADLDPVIGAYKEYIDGCARQLYHQGRLSQLYDAEPFGRRLARISEEDLEIYRQIDLMDCRLQGAFDFLCNEALMDLVESLIGPEILCSPIQHVRAKLPANLVYRGTDDPEEGRKQLEAMVAENVAPWHQDAQVHLEEADPSFILTVWLPLGDATPENGCLQVIPRVPATGVVYWSEGFGLDPQQVPDAEVVTLPMHKGDVLLMHKLTPHCSTPNLSEDIRWSMDLRYQRIGTPTGRSFYPEFATRSRANPALVLRNYNTWCRQWIAALEKIPTAQRPRRQQRPQATMPIAVARR
jgi:hypothetical protein